MSLNTVTIAFGSNKGNALNNIQQAIAAMAQLGKVSAVSPLFETKPEGFLEQANFINGTLLLLTKLTPQALLEQLQKIEILLGRQRTFRNAPREIDLDIIFYDNLTINTQALKIPHPSCHLREFVLLPLSFISPDKIHPVLKKTIKELLDQTLTLKGSSDCKKIANEP